MDYVHHCPFCGERREAQSSTVLLPHCQRCGCALACARHGDLENAVPARAEAPGPRRSAARRVAAIALVAVLVLVMANAGYRAGGVPIAMVACGLAFLVIVPALQPTGRAGARHSNVGTESTYRWSRGG